MNTSSIRSAFAMAGATDNGVTSNATAGVLRCTGNTATSGGPNIVRKDEVGDCSGL